ncbi:MAG TPA: RCC1 repeat-containing protein, partial [Polyangia bacterium]|nr:RCC1 repeat-containing protein [Polyangia bacterium]
CALGDDGAVACWGTNRSGELGLGTIGDPRSCAPGEVGNAALVTLPAAARAIVASREHACALLVTGQVTCWGNNASGQLGTSDTRPRLAPSEPLVFPPGFAPATLILGDDHACAIAANGPITCWGSNQRGQLGDVGADRSAPGPRLRVGGAPVSMIAAGGEHTCALLAGGALKCWGRNDAGQLGLGDLIDRGVDAAQMGDALPALPLPAPAIAVAVGAAHTCAILMGGAVTCWGDNKAGQLGAGAPVSSMAPSAPLALPSASTALAAGDDFTCALLTDGRVFCWGNNARGQLGTNTAGGAVTLPTAARAITAGGAHACAVLQNRALACWGANDAGQLGLGDTTDRVHPGVVTLGTKHVVSVASQERTTCILLDDHTVRCWGRNDRGQLGLGDASQRLSPAATAVALGTGQRASEVAAGGAFACALLDTAQAKCWGDNQTGQLGAFLRGPAYGDGPGETGDALATAVQGGGRAVTAIAAGRAHACALLDTDEVRCWGDNTHGQLGGGDANVHSLFSDPTGVVDLGSAP